VRFVFCVHKIRSTGNDTQRVYAVGNRRSEKTQTSSVSMDTVNSTVLYDPPPSSPLPREKPRWYIFLNVRDQRSPKILTDFYSLYQDPIAETTTASFPIISNSLINNSIIFTQCNRAKQFLLLLATLHVSAFCMGHHQAYKCITKTCICECGYVKITYHIFYVYIKTQREYIHI
jgi:hypothetical protein